MLVAGVIHDQVGDHPDAALVRLVDHFDEVPDVPEVRQNRHKVRNIVPAVSQR